jgi:hypothetical protein
MSIANTTTDAQAPPNYIRPDFGRMPPELKLLQAAPKATAGGGAP